MCRSVQHDVNTVLEGYWRAGVLLLRHITSGDAIAGATTVAYVTISTVADPAQADSAPQQVLCWDSWDTAAGQQQPVGLRLSEYFAAEVDGQAAASGSGPYLRTTYMAPFRAVIAAHRKSNDEHIRVTGLFHFARPE